MSQETRQKLVDHPRLVLTHHSQKSDLLDPTKTDTWLVQFLLSLVQSCATPLLVTALNTDHDPGTWHNPPGRGVDCWNADWASVGDENVRFILESASYISCSGAPKLIEVGLSGTAAQYLHSFDYCCDDVFVEDYGENNEHVHFAVGVPT
jgi:hypothetical protein